MKKETVTIYDVAEAAGISIATVSRVLNKPEKVSGTTKDRVFRIMKELGFTPKAEARERARRQVGRIGIITPYFTHPSFVHRLRGISEYLRGKAFELVIINLEEMEEIERYLQSPDLKHKIDGLIFLSQKLSSSVLEVLVESEIPAVFVEFGEEGFSGVCIDNNRGGKLAARFLTGKGYRTFTVLTEEESNIKVRPNEMRVAGFAEYLKEQGADLGKDRIFCCRQNLEDAVAVAGKMLLRFHPEAVFATNDLLAVAVIKAARKLSISIPDDMGVIGFDGTNTSEYLDMTTVDQSLEESGQLAAELLLSLMGTPAAPIRTIYLELKIAERATTATR